jgi:hypothetical protein
MLLEKDFWKAAGARSIRGREITLKALENIKAHTMLPSSEEERRAALNEARTKRPGASSEHIIWYEGKKQGHPDRMIEIEILRLQKEGGLIPSTALEIQKAKKEGWDYWLIDSKAARAKLNTQDVKLREMPQRVDFLPPDTLIEEGGLPPVSYRWGSSPNSFPFREYSGKSLTAAELWFRGIFNDIHPDEINRRVRAGIRRGWLEESPPELIQQAIQKARELAKKPPYAYGQVDIYSRARRGRDAVRALVPTMRQNAPYTATSRRGIEPIVEQAEQDQPMTSSQYTRGAMTRPVITTQNGVKQSVKPGTGAISTQGSRRKAREKTVPVTEVDKAREKIYREYGVAKQSYPFTRTIGPTVEPPPYTGTRQQALSYLTRRGRGAGLLAMSKIGIRESDKRKNQPLAGHPWLSANEEGAGRKSSYSTAEKVVMGMLGLGALGGAIWGINKLVRG